MDQPGRMPFGAVRTRQSVRDVLLTPPTPAEFSAWAKSMAKQVKLGVVWDGAIRPILDGLDDDDASRNMLLTAISAYGEAKAAQKEEQKARSKGAAGQDAKKSDLERARSVPAMDPMGTMDHLNHLDPERAHNIHANRSLNEANRQFWEKQPA